MPCSFYVHRVMLLLKISNTKARLIPMNGKKLIMHALTLSAFFCLLFSTPVKAGSHITEQASISADDSDPINYGGIIHRDGDTVK